MELISMIIHVTAAAVFVGPQLLMFYAVTPATWLIDDEALKRQLLAVIARRFGALAAISLVTLLVTGLYQFYTVVPDPIQEEMMDYRFGLIFVLKMTMFTAVLGLVLLHAMVFARRIRRLSAAVETGDATPEELQLARMHSFLISGVLMLASIATLWLGVTLGHIEYSYVLRD